MARVTVGVTTRGLTIAVDMSARNETNFIEIFAKFTERDKFDALMALRYLAVSELRKNQGDKAWLDAINLSLDHLGALLENQRLAAWSEHLGLTSAFAARDYGRAMVYKHFRYL